MSIEAMKQALEALENALEIMPRAGYTAGMQRQAADALRQSIAEAEKPFGWVHMTNGSWEDFFLYEEGVGECEDCEHCIPLYTIEAKLKEKNA